MKILLTGATGLIGRAVGARLAARGDTLACLVRDPAAARRVLPFPAACFAWDHSRDVPPAALDGVDAVVHLAGEPVADARWTARRKALIRDTRVLGTRRLVDAVVRHGERVGAFVHGSATGWYGDRGDEVLDAQAARGDGFLADVVDAWEAELRPLDALRARVRVPVVRTGVVLSRDGGALAAMLPLLRASAAGRLGDGRQWMGWIHLDDVARLFVHALDAPLDGVLEGVAPYPATNAEFTRAACRALALPGNAPVPAAALRALYGERADVLLASTRIEPRALRASGFRWRYESIEDALVAELAPLRGGTWVKTWAQWMPRPPQAVWSYFCDANNLEEMTPGFLNFHVLAVSTPELEAGTRLDYRLRLAGVPFRWQTLIETWEPPRRFVDTQARGPYALWHHTHDFEPLAGGTLMRDTVRYRLPAGPLGALLGGARVEATVNRIFDFRARSIDERFGSSSGADERAGAEAAPARASPAGA